VVSKDTGRLWTIK